MNRLLIAVSALASAMALQAAEVSSGALSFGTVGPDKYADGVTVLDGEVYAIVWSTDGVFDGFKADGTLVDANDALVAALPIAEKGRCPDVILNVADGSKYAAGTFNLYLLDTRKFQDGGKVTLAGVDAKGQLTFVNRAEKLDVEVKVSQAGGQPTSATAEAATGAGAVATALPAGADAAKITKLDFVGENVILTIEKSSPYVNYQINYGETPSATDGVGEAKVGNGDVIKLVAPKSGNSGFYTTTRK